MSLSYAATATLAAASAVATDDPDGRERRWGDQTSGQRDLYTQIVISVALGMGAFLSFCVCIFPWDGLISLSDRVIGTTTQMDGAICGSKTTTLRCVAIT